jgi:hypothetical protein
MNHATANSRSAQTNTTARATSASPPPFVAAVWRWLARKL